MSVFDLCRRACHLVLTLVVASSVGSCRSRQTEWTEDDGGVSRWIGVSGGRLKTRVYTGTTVSKSPVLVLVLHGDLPEPPPSYQYEFAKVIAERRSSRTCWADIQISRALRSWPDAAAIRLRGGRGEGPKPAIRCSKV